MHGFGWCSMDWNVICFSMIYLTSSLFQDYVESIELFEDGLIRWRDWRFSQRRRVSYEINQEASRLEFLDWMKNEWGIAEKKRVWSCLWKNIGEINWWWDQFEETTLALSCCGCRSKKTSRVTMEVDYGRQTGIMSKEDDK